MLGTGIPRAWKRWIIMGMTMASYFPSIKPIALRITLYKWVRRVTPITNTWPAVYKVYGLYPDAGISATMMIAALNSSISASTQPPGISCQTGNCTWPVYTTLGLCSTCFDISKHITTEHAVGLPDESIFSTCHLASFYSMINYTSYILPYTDGRRVLLQDTNGNIDQAACKLRSRVGLSAAFHPSQTYKFRGSDTLIASFAVLEVSADYWNNITEFEKATPKATECGLEFCALAHETQVRDGHPTERVVTRSMARVPNSYNFTDDLSPEIRAFIDQDFGRNWLTEGHKAFVAGSELRYQTIIPRHDLQVKLPENDSHGTSNLSIFNVTQRSIETMTYDLVQNSTLETLTYAISNTTNVTQTFDNIARLLTYRMREIDGSTAPGLTEQWVVFTVVQWNFLIFPVIVLVSGYIFTIGAAVDSHRLALRTMKSDTIATLLWGLDYNARQFLRAQSQQYDSCSDKILVKLTPQETGLELRAL